MNIENELIKLKSEMDNSNILFHSSSFDISSYRKKTIKKNFKILEEILSTSIPDELYALYENINGLSFRWEDGSLDLNDITSVVYEAKKSNSPWIIDEIHYLPLFTSFTSNFLLLIRFTIQEGSLKLFLVINDNDDGSNKIVPINMNLIDFLNDAIYYKGALYCQFFEEIFMNDLKTFTKQNLWDEIKNTTSLNHTDAFNWYKYISEFQSIPDLDISISGIPSLICFPLAYQTQNYFGHEIDKDVIRFFSQTGGNVDLKFFKNNKYFSSFKIENSYNFFSDQSLVWRYLELDESEKDELDYYGYRVLIYKETPVFIDVSNNTATLYLYEYSIQEVRKINLSFDEFIKKTFQCYGLENWEILFIEGKENTFEYNSVIDSLLEINPDFNINSFLQAENKIV